MSIASPDAPVTPVGHARHRLSDGREIVFFAQDPSRLPERIHDPRPGGPRARSGQLRQDPLTGDWVALATHRQHRTHLPPVDLCPLCPATEHRESEIPAPFEVVSFENRFPSLGPDSVILPEDDQTPSRTPRSAVAGGRCEVLVFTAEHQGSLARLPTEQVQLVLRAMAQRTHDLSRLPGTQVVFPFENRGEQIGTTLHHPHGQIYAYPYVPSRALRMAHQALAHHRRFGVMLHDDVISREWGERARVIRRGEHVTSFVPWAARWPLEIHVVPHRHVPDLAALGPDELDEYAELVRDALLRLAALYDTPTPYMAGWFQAPLVEGFRETSRLHLQIVSPRRAEHKLKYLATSEAAMGAFIGDVSPEDSARRLQEAL